MQSSINTLNIPQVLVGDKLKLFTPMERFLWDELVQVFNNTYDMTGGILQNKSK